MTSLVEAAWRSLRHRPGSVLAGFVALTLTAALASALAWIVDSEPFQRAHVERFAAAPIVVAPADPEQRLPAALVAALEQDPRLRHAVGEVRLPATVIGVGGRTVSRSEDHLPHAWGLGWSGVRLTGYDLAEGRPPRAPMDVVVDDRLAARAGVTVEDRLDIVVHGVPREYLVRGIVAPAHSRARHQSLLFLTDREATRLAGRGSGFDAIGVFPDPEVDLAHARQVTRGLVDSSVAAGPSAVLVATGSNRAELERTHSMAQDRQAATSHTPLLWTVVLLGGGVTAGAMGVVLRTRGKEIALLRALGATPRQVKCMVATECALIGWIAGLLGLPIGVWLATQFTRLDLGPRTGFSPVFTLVYRPAPAMLVVGCVTAAAVIAGLIALGAGDLGSGRPGDRGPTQARADGTSRRRLSPDALAGAARIRIRVVRRRGCGLARLPSKPRASRQEQSCETLMKRIRGTSGWHGSCARGVADSRLSHRSCWSTPCMESCRPSSDSVSSTVESYPATDGRSG